ncbi:MAG: hypothetical protein ACPLN0_06315 [Candidatus Hydrothermia bacterium]
MWWRPAWTGWGLYGAIPGFGRGWGCGLFPGLGRGFAGRFAFPYWYDKDYLNFVKKGIELQLEYMNSKLATNPDNEVLKLMKAALEARISFLNSLMEKFEKEKDNNQ